MNRCSWLLEFSLLVTSCRAFPIPQGAALHEIHLRHTQPSPPRIPVTTHGPRQPGFSKDTATTPFSWDISSAQSVLDMWSTSAHHPQHRSDDPSLNLALHQGPSTGNSEVEAKHLEPIHLGGMSSLQAQRYRHRTTSKMPHLKSSSRMSSPSSSQRPMSKSWWGSNSVVTSPTVRIGPQEGRTPRWGKEVDLKDLPVFRPGRALSESRTLHSTANIVAVKQSGNATNIAHLRPDVNKRRRMLGSVLSVSWGALPVRFVTSTPGLGDRSVLFGHQVFYSTSKWSLRGSAAVALLKDWLGTTREPALGTSVTLLTAPPGDIPYTWPRGTLPMWTTPIPTTPNPTTLSPTTPNPTTLSPTTPNPTLSPTTPKSTPIPTTPSPSSSPETTPGSQEQDSQSYSASSPIQRMRPISKYQDLFYRRVLENTGSQQSKWSSAQLTLTQLLPSIRMSRHVPQVYVAPKPASFTKLAIAADGSVSQAEERAPSGEPEHVHQVQRVKDFVNFGVATKEQMVNILTQLFEQVV